MALVMTKARIAPLAPTMVPVMIISVWLSMKPMPTAAQPE